MPSSKVKQNNPNLYLQDPIALLPLDYKFTESTLKSTFFVLAPNIDIILSSCYHSVILLSLCHPVIILSSCFHSVILNAVKDLFRKPSDNRSFTPFRMIEQR